MTSADFHTTTERVARKPHRCICCDTDIAPGVRYKRIAAKWQGDFWSGKAHIDCYAAYWPLCDILGVSGGDEFSLNYVEEMLGWSWFEVRDTLDSLRGRFPHVTSRIEFRLRHLVDEDEAAA